MSELEPWIAHPSSISAIDLFALVETSIRSFHDSHPSELFASARLLDVLAEIAALPGMTAGTVDDAYRGSANAAIRLDVDVDLLGACLFARALETARQRASFFVLPTAGYAGWRQPDGWHRHTCVAPAYLALQQAGEVGLHLDPWGLIDNHRIDGVAAVADELSWLRSLGVRVNGVSSHNAAPVHGRENVEVFAEWQLEPPVTGRARSTPLPAGALSAADLGLAWCAGRPAAGGGPQTADWLSTSIPADPLRSETWLWHQIHSGQYCRWRDDVDIWLLGNDRWAVSDRRRDSWHFNISSAAVVSLLASRTAEAVATEVVAITLHPLYIGWDDRPPLPECLR